LRVPQSAFRNPQWGAGAADAEMDRFWTAIFGNDQPVEIEIGPGTGTFLLAAAAHYPGTNFFGIEHARGRAFRLQAAIATRGLTNARVIAADAACVVATLTPPASVRAVHIYFPDPWWKRRHHRRRLFTAEFAVGLARMLVPHGRLCVATDVEEVFALVLRTLAGSGLTRNGSLRSPRLGATAFEHKGLRRGVAIHEAVFVKTP